MAQPLHTFLYCEDSEKMAAFRQSFDGKEELNIVGVCGKWSEIAPHLTCRKLDAIIVDIDSLADGTASSTLAEMVELTPDRAVIAVSDKNTPDAILGAMRAGCGQFIHWPVAPDDFRQVIEQVMRLRRPARAKTRCISVVGAAGGAGTTTVAANLALELALATDQQCALLDMHPCFGDIGCAFDVQLRYSIADVCAEGMEIDSTMLGAAMEALPCHVSILGQAEGADHTKAVSPEQVGRMLQVMSGEFPFVVMDMPRHLSPVDVMAFRLSHRVLIVAQLTVPHLRNAGKLFDALVRLGVNEQKIDFIVNRCHSAYENVTVTQVEEHFGRKVLAAIPNDYKRLGHARDYGRPLAAAAPNSPVRAAIADIAKQLHREYRGPEDAQSSEGGGLLGFFRKRRARQEVTVS